ncbi:prepilin-type N-terminal cleavage/methylation domain-containing protein [Clostridium sp. NSJ-145]|uniref:PilW family protein n=1 Tax=Clostridium sp. NSJ-145 TaxID=2897777 RepID=UPI001E429A55|nr:prepilin-type N-terminal cleavage/methylation domain-containing protein [Clostridium sp. NSJ-145]MCD2501929.1 prepilin-type N-terminal cleavage/methylation domain-containing protein [Clostridium sp. NSJ-145]
MKKKSTGFTVIELVITLAITTMIIGVAYTFFFTNNKTLNTTEINSELQYEAENIEKLLLNLGTQAKNIEIVDNIAANDPLNKYSLLPINSVEEKNYKKSINNIVLNYEDTSRFELTLESNGTLKASFNDESGTSDIAETILSTNVIDIKIRPLDVRMIVNEGIIKMESTLLSDSPGLEFNITLAKKKGYSDVKYESTVLVKFRNN